MSLKKNSRDYFDFKHHSKRLCMMELCIHGSSCRFRTVEYKSNQMKNCIKKISDKVQPDYLEFKTEYLLDDLYQCFFEYMPEVDFICTMESADYIRNLFYSFPYATLTSLKSWMKAQVRLNRSLDPWMHHLWDFKIHRPGISDKTLKNIRSFNREVLLEKYDRAELNIFTETKDAMTKFSVLSEATTNAIAKAVSKTDETCEKFYDCLESSFGNFDKNLDIVTDVMSEVFNAVGSDASTATRSVKDKINQSVQEVKKSVQKPFNDFTTKEYDRLMSKLDLSLDGMVNLPVKTTTNVDKVTDKISDMISKLDVNSNASVQKFNKILDQFMDPLTNAAKGVSFFQTLFINLKTHAAGILAAITSITANPTPVGIIAGLTSIGSMLGLEQAIIDRIIKCFEKKPSAQVQTMSPTVKLASLLLTLTGVELGATKFINLTKITKEAESMQKITTALQEVAAEWGFYETELTKTIKRTREEIVKYTEKLVDFETKLKMTPSEFYKPKIHIEVDLAFKEITQIKELAIRSEIDRTLSEEIKFLYLRYKKFYVDYKEMQNACARRVEPTAYVFTGKPGIGKTELMVDMVTNTPNQKSFLQERYEEMGLATLPEWQELDMDNWTVWAQNLSKDMKYQDGYYQQQIHMVDDGFQNSDDEDHIQWINFISSSHFITNQADLNAKGRPYTSRLITVSANKIPKTSKTINEIDALHRRFNIIHVMKKPNASVPSGTKDRTYDHLIFKMYENMTDYLERNTTHKGVTVTIKDIADFFLQSIMAKDKFYRSSIGLQSGTISDEFTYERIKDTHVPEISRMWATNNNPYFRRVFGNCGSTLEDQELTLTELSNIDFTYKDIRYVFQNWDKITKSDKLRDYFQRTFVNGLKYIDHEEAYYLDQNMDLHHSINLDPTNELQEIANPNIFIRFKEDLLERYHALIKSMYNSCKFLKFMFRTWRNDPVTWNLLLNEESEVNCFMTFYGNIGGFEPWKYWREYYYILKYAGIGAFLALVPFILLAIFFIIVWIDNKLRSNNHVCINYCNTANFVDQLRIQHKEWCKENCDIGRLWTSHKAECSVIYNQCNIITKEACVCSTFTPKYCTFCMHRYNDKFDFRYRDIIQKLVDRCSNSKPKAKALKFLENCIFENDDEIIQSQSKFTLVCPQNLVKYFPKERINNHVDPDFTSVQYLSDLEDYLEDFTDNIVCVFGFSGSAKHLYPWNKFQDKVFFVCKDFGRMQYQFLDVGQIKQKAQVMPKIAKAIMYNLEDDDNFALIYPTFDFVEFKLGNSFCKNNNEEVVDQIQANFPTTIITDEDDGSKTMWIDVDAEPDNAKLENGRAARENILDISLESSSGLQTQRRRARVQGEEEKHDEPKVEQLKLENSSGLQTQRRRAKVQADAALEVCTDPQCHDTLRSIQANMVKVHARGMNKPGALHGIGYKNKIVAPAHIRSYGTSFFFTPMHEDEPRIPLTLLNYDDETELCVFKFDTKLYHPFNHKLMNSVPKRADLIRCLQFVDEGFTYIPSHKARYGVQMKLMTKFSIDLEEFGPRQYPYVLRATGITMRPTPTQKGDCGAPLVMSSSKLNKKLIGMHFAGGITYGYAALLCEENLIDLGIETMNVEFAYEEDPYFIDTPASLPVVDPCNMLTLERPIPRYPVTETSIKYIGMAPYQTAPATKSSLLEHPLKGAFPVTQLPSALHVKDVKFPENLAKDSMDKPSLTWTQFKKYGSHETKADDISEFLEEAEPQLYQHLKPYFKNKDLSPMNEEQVWTGCWEMQDAKEMDVNTSAGEPWSRIGTSAGKKKTAYLKSRVDPLTNKKVWSFNDQPHTEQLKKAIDLKESLAEKGIRTLSVWKNCLKDETRPIEKVEIGKTRLFTAAPMESVYLLRKYFEKFKIIWTQNRIELPHAVGINAASREWKEVYMKLSAKNKRGSDADFGNFDTRARSDFMRMIGRVICKIIAEQSNVSLTLLTTLWEEIVETFTISEDEIYLTMHGNPSGNPLTTLVNCLVNLCYHWFCYWKITGELSLFVFLSLVCILTFGDDVIYASSDPRYCFSAIQQWMEYLGQVYTNGSKNDKYTDAPIDELRFLKRAFKCKESIVYAPLDQESIEQQFNYSQIQGSDILTMQAQIEEALLEAAMNGKNYFGRFSKALKTRIEMSPYDKDLQFFYNFKSYQQKLIKRITELD